MHDAPLLACCIFLYKLYHFSTFFMYLAHLFLPVHHAFRACILNRKTSNRKNIEYFLAFPYIIFARCYIVTVCILCKIKTKMGKLNKNWLQYLFCDFKE